MNCPRCKSSEYSKDGIVNLRPRYKCKKCVYRYTVEKKSDLKSDETKRLALEMYLEGLGFRSIGRILKISYGSVYKWVKEWGEKVSLPKSTRPIEMAELDEMHTYIMSKKNYGWLWIAVDRFGKRYVDFVRGDRATQTFKKLWVKIKDLEVNGFCSDYWKSYSELIPRACLKTKKFNKDAPLRGVMSIFNARKNE